ncbi:cupin domain-containing protein [Shewanella sp. Isolate11]|uniref:cupin domain-containing protein n=1 Tax=Shewanella sp. Isolate11 TaxID=2908530 RepID=UPI001EFE35A1|nr:cupin domain-containing protein [Shewanella sp. Isolate11]MCG9695867.1 cupin domain-containing protein [Shewanella sp. Isolate11]
MSINIDAIINFSQQQTETEYYDVAKEKVISGDPKQQLNNHYSSPCEQFHAGVWQGEKGSWKVNYTEYEYCEILQGCSEITDNSGKSITVTKGDRFVIPAGFSGVWKVIDTCRKIYVIFEQK